MAVAYVLCRLDLASRCAYLRSNDAQRREFTVSVASPPRTPLPRWAAWFGAKRGEPQLIWGSARLSPRGVSFLSGLDFADLWKIVLGVVLLWCLALWHLPRGISLVGVLTSRYALATVLLVGVYLWGELTGYLRRLEVDLSGMRMYSGYALRLPPKGFRAGVKSVQLGRDTLRVVEVRVSSVIHWIHAGPEVDGAHYHPEARLRLQGGGSEFEFRTLQGESSHPFVVSGDVLRLLVDDACQGRPRAVAYANLSDGHMAFDETDKRLSTMTGGVAIPGALLFFLVPGFLLTWLGMGPYADDGSAVLLFISLAATAVLLISTGLRRARRARLAHALGARLNELAARRIEVARLPQIYFG